MLTLIFLNGKFPALKIINYYLRKKHFIVAADGGANSLRRIKLVPDIIIGDFDSVSKQTLMHYEGGKTTFRKIEEQETTDFEKCLRYCFDKGEKNLIVFGATSMRPDHTLNNYSILKRYFGKLNIRLITDEYEIFFVDQKTEFDYIPGQTVSLLAMPQAKGVTATGLKYTVNNMNFEFGTNEGTLNSSVSKRVSVSLKTGFLLLFKKHFIQS